MSSSLQFIFREATKKDLSRLSEIEKASFPAALYHDCILSKSEFRSYLKDKDYALNVITTDNDVIGYFLLDIAKDDPSASNLESMAIDEKWRGHKVGYAAMNFIEELSLKHGFGAVSLQVHERNTPAIGLYKKMGYEAIDEEPDYYSDGGSLIEMQKTLSPRL